MSKITASGKERMPEADEGKREIENAWLCGEAVDWAPVGRAAEFVLATKKDPELKMNRLAAIVGGVAVLATMPGGFGIATMVAAVAGYGGVYLGSTFAMLAARQEAFRVLAKAGFEWRDRVRELAGQGQDRLMRKIGITHDVVMAVEASLSWEKQEAGAGTADPQAMRRSAMGDLCLRLATAWGSLLWEGKWAKTTRAQAKESVDGEAVGRSLFPMRLAQIEGEQIERELGASKAPRSGPKRM